jgi:hypothetical protein
MFPAKEREKRFTKVESEKIVKRTTLSKPWKISAPPKGIT